MGEKKQTARYYFTREIARAVAKRKLKGRKSKLMRQMGRLHHSWFANHWRTIAMQGI